MTQHTGTTLTVGPFDTDQSGVPVNSGGDSEHKMPDAPGAQDNPTNGPQPAVESPIASINGTGKITNQLPSSSKPGNALVNDSHEQTRTGDEPAEALEKRLLDYRIRARIIYVGSGKGSFFLPRDQLDDIITYENVVAELNLIGYEKKPEWAASNVSPSGAGNQTSRPRRQIFAILCLLRRAADITSFIEEDINDDDLPFHFDSNPNENVYCKTKKDAGVAKRIIKLFHSWPGRDRDGFDSYQWGMLAPCFEFSYDISQPFFQYDLSARTIFPYLEEKKTTGVGDSVLTQRNALRSQQLPSKLMERLGVGGSSVVWRVKIHPAHFNARPGKDSNGCVFAVKELIFPDGPSKLKGEEEIRALKRLNNQPHEHLIRLLACYMYDDHYHMIFPWADGNLQELWNLTDIHRAKRDPQLVRWMSSQVVGLADALLKIHRCESSSNQQDKTYGRHGDLKPQNILWFKDRSFPENDPRGVLKIADFGLTEFHNLHTVDVRISAVLGFTDTYKAPESEVTRVISPQYDIWSFGCILLQFVDWFMFGWDDGVDRFSEARAAESERGSSIKNDKFHLVETKNARLHQFVGKMKQSVSVEMQRIEQANDANDYILDLLAYIQDAMLRLNPSNRERMDSIVPKLVEFNKQCQDSDSYCTRKRAGRPPTRRETSHSELVGPSNSPKVLQDCWEHRSSISSVATKRQSRELLENQSPQGARAIAPTQQSLLASKTGQTRQPKDGVTRTDSMPEFVHGPMGFHNVDSPRSERSSLSTNDGEKSRISSARERRARRASGGSTVDFIPEVQSIDQRKFGSEQSTPKAPTTENAVVEDAGPPKPEVAASSLAVLPPTVANSGVAQPNAQLEHQQPNAKPEGPPPLHVHNENDPPNIEIEEHAPIAPKEKGPRRRRIVETLSKLVTLTLSFLCCVK